MPRAVKRIGKSKRPVGRSFSDLLIVSSRIRCLKRIRYRSERTFRFDHYQKSAVRHFVRGNVGAWTLTIHRTAPQ